jgi:hypothetical protein
MAVVIIQGVEQMEEIPEMDIVVVVQVLINVVGEEAIQQMEQQEVQPQLDAKAELVLYPKLQEIIMEVEAGEEQMKMITTRLGELAGEEEEEPEVVLIIQPEQQILVAAVVAEEIPGLMEKMVVQE